MIVYFLLWSSHAGHDLDEYIGIYTNILDLKAAFNTMMVEGPFVHWLRRNDYSDTIEIKKEIDLYQKFGSIESEPYIYLYEEVDLELQHYKIYRGVSEINQLIEEHLDIN